MFGCSAKPWIRCTKCPQNQAAQHSFLGCSYARSTSCVSGFRHDSTHKPLEWKMQLGSQELHPAGSFSYTPSNWHRLKASRCAADWQEHRLAMSIRPAGKRRTVANVFNPKRNWLENLLFQRMENWNTVTEDPRAAEESVRDPNPIDSGEFGDIGDEEDAEDAEDLSDTDDLDDIDRMLADDTSFSSWKRKRDAINELREFQETGRDPDSKDWEDWLDDSYGDYSDYVGGKDSGWYYPQTEWEKGGLPRDPPKKPERGMKRTIKELFFRIFEREEEVEDDLLFEERVFRFTSQATAKFVACLIVVPWFMDFVVHDYLLVPFLRRYVETVPLAAQVLDVRESQKLQIIERLKLERQRVRFEAEIGRAPPLSDDELSEHIRDEALHLREELREENRQAFANIWSDFVAGCTVFLLLLFNPKQVAIMRMTGDRLFTNISDTGKAFVIILLTDIFLGYHSETGWETVIEIVLDHYGIEMGQGSIYIFVAIVPVTIDACFKLWVFRFLTRTVPFSSCNISRDEAALEAVLTNFGSFSL